MARSVTEENVNSPSETVVSEIGLFERREAAGPDGFFF